MTINTVISVTAALPAAYAFSRYRFVGDKHLFFWLFTNRMAPAAVFALPFLQLYYAIGLFDTHLGVALAHCLFNIPLAVWILEGFMSGVPKELDETAYVDGYSFPRFFLTIFIPNIKAGIGVAAFFCFMFSWVEMLLVQDPDLGAGQADRRGDDPHRLDLGLRARPARRRRRPDHHPRRHRHLVRPQLHRQGLRPGTGVMRALALPTALLLLTAPALAQTPKAGWGNVGEQEPKGFSWTRPAVRRLLDGLDRGDARLLRRRSSR